MRELSDEVRSTILRSFSAREAEMADAAERGDHSWKWCDGVVLFPEGKCPFCSATITSSRIWKLGSLSSVGVQGRWKVVDGQVVRDELADHPHVLNSNGGPVCVGTYGSDVLTALFFGMNPGDEYWTKRGQGNGVWNEWLARVWDHLCPRLNRGPRSHVHNYESVCTLMGCEVRWLSGVAGCVCGCKCHRYDPAGCSCGHPGCYCPAPLICAECKASTAEAGYMTCSPCSANYCQSCFDSGEHLAHEAEAAEYDEENGEDESSDESDDEEFPDYCVVCDSNFEDVDRSECCTDRCTECHDSDEF